MDLAFETFDPGQADLLARWLSSETWPYHTVPEPDFDRVRKQIAAGEYAGADDRAFWAVVDGGRRVGLVRLEYLDEISPTTDFRVLSAYRGRGIGCRMVRWAAEYVFSTFPEKPRLEGQTRADNTPMRRVFERCGWTLEAYYRSSWPDGSNYADSVGYSILRDDWLGWRGAHF